MKLAFYISSLSGGGAEKVLVTIANHYAKEGHEVHIVSLEKRKQFYVIDKRIILHKQQNKGNSISVLIKDFLFIKNCFSNIASDVTISFLSRTNLLLLISRIFVNHKLVVCDRNNPLKEHSKVVFFLSCQLYRLANEIVVQTNKIKSYYPKYLQKKISVIENPLDMDSLNRQLIDGEESKEQTIISAGRLEKQKDFYTLIKAFKESDVASEGWKLKIFGQGKMRQELENYSESLALGNEVEFCGPSKVLFREMKNSDIFVLSSFYEGFPNVLCEAMYAGLPCIATDCVSGPSELITDTINGFLVPVGDVEKMAEKIWILAHDVKLREDLGKNAKQRTSSLTLDSIANEWNHIFERM